MNELITPSFDLVNPLTLRIGDMEHPIKIGAPEEISGYAGTYRYHHIQMTPLIETGEEGFYSEQMSEIVDGGIYQIPRYSTTRLVKLTAPGIMVLDRIHAGEGWLVGMPPHPLDEVFVRPFSVQNPQIHLTMTNWRVCFVAGETGLSVLELCIPPFPSDGEVHAEKFNQPFLDEEHKEPLPPHLWETIRGLCKGFDQDSAYYGF